MAGPSGPAGPQGPQGLQGAQGPAGLGINFKGSVATVAQLPATGQQQGDAYLVEADDSLRVWSTDSNSWVNGGSIQGPAGPQGPQGPAGGAGPQGATGPQGPAGSQGSKGADGAAGPRGTGWFVGSGAPSGVIEGAAYGDLYLDFATGTVYTLGPLRVADLPAIGTAFEGGFYAGLISQSGNGVATHALILSPKDTGELAPQTVSYPDYVAGGVAWKPSYGNTPNTGSTFDGYANTMAMDTATHPVAAFVRGLSIGGFSDWYIPAPLEMNAIWRNLKPTTDANDTTTGANAHAVPAAGNFAAGTPARTALVGFQEGGDHCLNWYDELGGTGVYWTSQQADNDNAYLWYPSTGRLRAWEKGTKSIDGDYTIGVRAIRKVEVMP